VTLDPALAAGLNTATLLDLIERPLEGNGEAASARLEGHTLRVPVPANGFVTVRLH
jgi:hypothetical protein